MPTDFVLRTIALTAIQLLATGILSPMLHTLSVSPDHQITGRLCRIYPNTSGLTSVTKRSRRYNRRLVAGLET